MHDRVEHIIRRPVAGTEGGGEPPAGQCVAQLRERLHHDVPEQRGLTRSGPAADDEHAGTGGAQPFRDLGHLGGSALEEPGQFAVLGALGLGHEMRPLIGVKGLQDLLQVADGIEGRGHPRRHRLLDADQLRIVRVKQNGLGAGQQRRPRVRQLAGQLCQPDALVGQVGRSQDGTQAFGETAQARGALTRDSEEDDVAEPRFILITQRLSQESSEVA